MVALDDCDKLICLGTESWLHKDMNFMSCFVSGILRCLMRLFICRTSGTESVVLHGTKISLSLCIPPSNRQGLTVQTVEIWLLGLRKILPIGNLRIIIRRMTFIGEPGRTKTGK